MPARDCRTGAAGTAGQQRGGRDGAEDADSLEAFFRPQTTEENAVLEYRSFEKIVDHPGLRVVLVKGLPSPWGQAAKTIFELKGLDYVAAPWLPGEPNLDIVGWGGEASAPIVAWAEEKPIHRWVDILYLAERLAPKPSLIPANATQRALMIGL